VRPELVGMDRVLTGRRFRDRLCQLPLAAARKEQHISMITIFRANDSAMCLWNVAAIGLADFRGAIR